MKPKSVLYSILLTHGFRERQLGESTVLENPDKSAIAKAFKEGAVLFDLSTRGKVEVTGPEAAMFLHNLCTNDITGMPIGAGCEAFFCNSRARPVAWANIFHVLLSRGRQGFWIDLPPGTEEILLKHLDQHLISEQAEFCDRTSDFGQIHLTGSRSSTVLSAVIDSDLPPLGAWEHMERNIGPAICHIRRLDWLGQPGYDIAFLSKHAGGVIQSFKDLGVVLGDEESWQAMRIPAGLPESGMEITEQVFIPELGRNKMAVCDNKGCYLGQEPIVMARDRGQINRKLMLLKIHSDVPYPGMSIHLHGKEVGKITSVAPSICGETLALGFIRKEGWKSDSLQIIRSDNGEGEGIEILPWPLQ